MATDGLAIVVRGLTKRYGGRAVVDGVSFEVARGECLALLGPNGAGKTTIIEILEGYRGADAGAVTVLGLDPVRDGELLKPRIGLMLQEGGLYPSIRPSEVVRTYAKFFASPADPGELLRLVGLETAAGTKYRQLSGGQKQRLALALALVGRPELVFLDEPTSGMDPEARIATWEIIATLKGVGVTVLLTTHLLDEAERLADRVAILDRGRLVALDAPAALRESGSPTRITFRARAGLHLGDLVREVGARGVREEAPGAYVLDLVPTPAAVAAVTAWLARREILIAQLSTGAESLETTYLRMTGAASRGSDGERS
jgi:ABC-2 type transport system ATP-binding protein